MMKDPEKLYQKIATFPETIPCAEDDVVLSSKEECKREGCLLKELCERERGKEKVRHLPWEDALEGISITIKHDEIIKQLCFFTFLSMYSDFPMNMFFKSETATGKTWIPLQISDFFPHKPNDRDVIKIMQTSPTAFFYQTGKWDDKKEILTLRGRDLTVMALDQPNDQLLEALKSLLSHDEVEAERWVTDKALKSGMRTKKVKVSGFPVWIFSTSHLGVSDEIANRGLVVSPDDDPGKIAEILAMITRQRQDPRKFKKEVEWNPKRIALRLHVLRIRDFMRANRHEDDAVMVQIPYMEKICERFKQEYEFLIPRNSRDYDYLGKLIEAITIYNFMEREWVPKDRILISEPKDGEMAFTLLEPLMDCIKKGVTPAVLRFYKKIILPLIERNEYGIARKEIIHHYIRVYQQPLSAKRLKTSYLDPLLSANLIIETVNPIDKKEKLYIPAAKDNTSSGGVGIQEEGTTPQGTILTIEDKVLAVIENLDEGTGVHIDEIQRNLNILNLVDIIRKLARTDIIKEPISGSGYWRVS